MDVLADAGAEMDAETFADERELREVEATSISAIRASAGQLVIPAADRLLSHTMPVQNLEDQLVDDSTQTVQPAASIAPAWHDWEVVPEAPLRGFRGERAVVSASRSVCRGCCDDA